MLDLQLLNARLTITSGHQGASVNSSNAASHGHIQSLWLSPLCHFSATVMPFMQTASGAHKQSPYKVLTKHFS